MWGNVLKNKLQSNQGWIQGDRITSGRMIFKLGVRVLTQGSYGISPTDDLDEDSRSLCNETQDAFNVEPPRDIVGEQLSHDEPLPARGEASKECVFKQEFRVLTNVNVEKKGVRPTLKLSPTFTLGLYLMRLQSWAGNFAFGSQGHPKAGGSFVCHKYRSCNSWGLSIASMRSGDISSSPQISKMACNDIDGDLLLEARNSVEVCKSVGLSFEAN
ncbi:hypothetical protein V6N11_035371 [Hibiscus sabdariffa]|uniref:Uncharacterized protein n=1 Tax=Hibiscus sabdariffa TaxID=183260 RepID=A0ABR2R081_9ROSI